MPFAGNEMCGGGLGDQRRITSDYGKHSRETLPMYDSREIRTPVHEK
jgi:hypothetical protein